METLLIGAGTIVAVVGYIWLTVLAFKQGVGWGVALVLFFPMAGCVYLFADTTKKTAPLVVLCAGGLLNFVGLAFLDF